VSNIRHWPPTIHNSWQVTNQRRKKCQRRIWT
jgi:hypothetical protein